MRTNEEMEEGIAITRSDYTNLFLLAHNYRDYIKERIEIAEKTDCERVVLYWERILKEVSLVIETHTRKEIMEGEKIF